MSNVARGFARIVSNPVVLRTSRPICTLLARKISAPLHQPRNLAQNNDTRIIKRCGSDWTSDSILERIVYVLKTYDKIDSTKIHLDADLAKDLGLDSLDLVEVTFHIERSMFTWITDEERETIETVRDIWEICMHKLLYNKA